MKWTASFIVCLLTTCSAAWALSPDELVLIVNRNEPAGLELAEFYVKARLVPEGRVLVLELPKSDEIAYAVYEQQVVPQVRKFIRNSGLQEKVRCLVTVYGVPLRVKGKSATSEDKAEIASLRQQHEQVSTQVAPVVVAVEDLLKKLDPTFEPAPDQAFDALAQRAELAISQVARRVLGPESQNDDIATGDARARLFRAIGLLAGSAALAQQFNDEQVKHLGLTESELAEWPDRRAAAEKTQLRFRELLDRRFDPAARQEMLTIAREQFGLFGLARLINSQTEYLETDGTSSAFDNELSMVWWDWYSHVKWQTNFLHYRARAQGITSRVPPVMMVSRLDAPTKEIVRDSIILGSLQAEKKGLAGQFVLDRRGLPANSTNKDGKPDGFGPFDQTLQTLANLVRERTELPVLLDDRAAVIPATAAVKDVGLYCGWYSVGKYVRAFDFNEGAVGYHIASFELLTLHRPTDGWCANLLRDGVVGTLGPVAEPYLHAFPLPDEFFPLLLTGKLTLAETYWSTSPLTSWMMTLVGDPLYNPFKLNPQITSEELPERLRPALSMPSPAAAQVN